MRFKLQQRVVDAKVTITGKIIASNHDYFIVRTRWLKKPLYVRLETEWLHKLNSGDLIGLQFVRCRYEATKFTDCKMSTRDKSLAERILKELKEHPDRFIEQ